MFYFCSLADSHETIKLYFIQAKTILSVAFCRHLSMRIFAFLLAAQAPFLERKFRLRIQFAIESPICKSKTEIGKERLSPQEKLFKMNMNTYVACTAHDVFCQFDLLLQRTWTGGSSYTLLWELIHLRVELLPLPRIQRDNVCCCSCYVQCGALCAYNQPASHPTTRLIVADNGGNDYIIRFEMNWRACVRTNEYAI